MGGTRSKFTLFSLHPQISFTLSKVRGHYVFRFKLEELLRNFHFAANEFMIVDETSQLKLEV